jgi:heme O synthase-like polyprenyltransferase
VAADLNVVYFGVVLGLGGYWCSLAFSSPTATDRRQWARNIFTFSIVLILALNLAMSLGSVLVRPLAGPGHQQPALGQAQTWLSPPRK